MAMDGNQAQLMTADETAEKLGVSPRQVRNLVYRRQIPFVKVGRLVRFNPTVIEEWVVSRSVPVGG